MTKRISFLNSSNIQRKDLHPEVKIYIKELESINAKLHLKIAKLESTNLDYANEIIAIKEERKKLKKKLSEAVGLKVYDIRGKKINVNEKRRK